MLGKFTRKSKILMIFLRENRNFDHNSNNKVTFNLTFLLSDVSITTTNSALNIDILRKRIKLKAIFRCVIGGDYIFGAFKTVKFINLVCCKD